VVGVWTLSVVSAVFWLLLLNSEGRDIDGQFAVAIASGLGAGLAAISLGIALAVNRSRLSTLLILSMLAGLAICSWSAFWWWTFHNLLSGTGPFL